MSTQSNVCACAVCPGPECTCGCDARPPASCQCAEVCNGGQTCTCQGCQHLSARQSESAV